MLSKKALIGPDMARFASSPSKCGPFLVIKWSSQANSGIQPVAAKQRPKVVISAVLPATAASVATEKAAAETGPIVSKPTIAPIISPPRAGEVPHASFNTGCKASASALKGTAIP